MAIISKGHRDEPHAAEWEARLVAEFGAVLDDLDYPWDAPVPPPADWDREVKEFRAHLRKLGYDL